MCIRDRDEVALCTFYAANFEGLKRSCRMDTDVPQIKELPDKVNLQPRLDMQSLDAFLKDMETVQLCLDSF